MQFTAPEIADLGNEPPHILELYGAVADGTKVGDLPQRGPLDETRVGWCTEFGRMPTFQKGAEGRDHTPMGSHAGSPALA